MHRIAVFLMALVLSLGGVRLAQAQSLADLAAQARSVIEETAKPAAAPAPAAQQPMVGQLSIPVPAVNIHAGEVITAGMLQQRTISSVTAERYPIITTSAPLIGRVARRLLPVGNPIPANGVGDAKMITRGISATILFQEGGLSIRAVGVPLESGSVGAVVRLKNLDSGQIVTGTVQSDGTVKVGS